MRLLICSFAAICFVGSWNASQVSASDDLNSSFVATCVGDPCQQISFVLDVSGDVFLSYFRVWTNDPTLFEFASLSAVFDRDGNNVTANWTSGVYASGQLLIAGTGDYTADAVTFVVDMVPLNGTAADLVGGNLEFFAQGYQQMDANGVGSHFFSTGGVVEAPEPSSVLLLATGLVGMLMMGRRRKDSFGGDVSSEKRSKDVNLTLTGRVESA